MYLVKEIFTKQFDFKELEYILGQCKFYLYLVIEVFTKQFDFKELEYFLGQYKFYLYLGILNRTRILFRSIQVLFISCYRGITKIQFDFTEPQYFLGQYKFYLSFENALCDDYATEKFFNVIRELPTVPIAMGETREWFVRQDQMLRSV